MATVASPYGLIPVKLIGGQPFAGSTRMLPIASNYTTAVFNGDVVTLSSGTVVKDTGTTASTPIGVFLGVEWQDPIRGLVHSQSFPSGGVTIVTGTTIMAYVCDDPDALFMLQASGTLTQAAVGKNGDLVQNAGSAATGKSAVALATTALDTTATRPIRVIDFVSPVGDAFPDLLVKLNTHRYNSATGI